MPLVTIHTSGAVKNAVEFMSQVTAITSEELGKPESVVMVRVNDKAMMSFGDDSIETSCLFEIEGIELSSTAAPALTTKFCELAEQFASTQPSRVFVKLTDVPRGMWGGNGKVY